MFVLEELFVVKIFRFVFLLLKNLFLEELEGEFGLWCLFLVIEFVKYIRSLKFLIDFWNRNLYCLSGFFIIDVFGVFILD